MRFVAMLAVAGTLTTTPVPAEDISYIEMAAFALLSRALCDLPDPAMYDQMIRAAMSDLGIDREAAEQVATFRAKQIGEQIVNADKTSEFCIGIAQD
ncbi:hypothetical protein SAMN05877838_2120 [Hoeflea halophila]|uniref:Uncharacterized protein n=1 Tax=Hoeflea halophila TaxID=714899 RepID=A0A286IAT2_9HYPH|nr:hypothetical protein [Hoeflea halophila]SOE17225.1 hypothetical protein SAMN05877838_2120 [Hoeflea halophila]